MSEDILVDNEARKIEVLLGDSQLNVWGHPSNPSGYSSDFFELNLSKMPLRDLGFHILWLSQTNSLAFNVMLASFMECVERRADSTFTSMIEQEISQYPKTSLVFEVTEVLVEKFSRLSESALLNYLDHLPPIRDEKSKNANPEKLISDRLAFELGGIREVTTPCGRIDVLTDTEIIEVKKTSRWKSAIGQVCAYANFYPDRVKRIHLFGGDFSQLALISSVAHPLDIRVTAE
jgi:hypothetical protein